MILLVKTISQMLATYPIVDALVGRQLFVLGKNKDRQRQEKG